MCDSITAGANICRSDYGYHPQRTYFFAVKKSVLTGLRRRQLLADTADLLNVQFAPAWRGYNRTQVDEFIRRLIGEYEELVRKYNKLKEKEPGQAVSTDDVGNL